MQLINVEIYFWLFQNKLESCIEGFNCKRKPIHANYLFEDEKQRMHEAMTF